MDNLKGNLVSTPRVSKRTACGKSRFTAVNTSINKPEEAESIWQDILAVDHDNQDARITLILSLTDNFSDEELMNKDD